MVGEEAVDALVSASSNSNSSESEWKDALRSAFTAFMTAPEAAVAKCTAALRARLESQSFPEGDLSPPAVAKRLCAQFPGDVGVFAPFWLNVLRLQVRALDPASRPSSACVHGCEYALASGLSSPWLCSTSRFRFSGGLYAGRRLSVFFPLALRRSETPHCGTALSRSALGCHGSGPSTCLHGARFL